MSLNYDPFADLPSEEFADDPFADLPMERRRGGVRSEFRPFVAGSPPPSQADVRRTEPVEKPAPRPFRDKREAIDDAVDRIELGQPAEDVFKAFAQIGVSREEIIRRGSELGGPAFAPQRPARERSAEEQAFYAKMPQGEIKNLRRQGGGVLSGVGDVAATGAQGVVTGFKMLADAFGADNTVSAALAKADRYIDALRSVAATQDDERIAEILADADGKGAWAQIAAGVKAAGVAPAPLIAKGIGTSVPTILAMLLPGVRESFVASLATGAAVGVAQGAGSAKSSIKQEVVDELLKAGYTKIEAQERGELAQRYLGKNADSIALQAALGAASVLGVERVGAGALKRLLAKGSAKEGMELLVRDGLLKRAGKTALEEAPVEFLQEAGEQVAGNVAVQREGIERGTFDGAFAAGTMGALAGAGAGGVVGAAAGPLRVDNSKEAQFARALALDASDRWQDYTQNQREADVRGFAQRALSPFSILNSPNAVDSRLPVRVEDMPSEPLTPEQVDAIAQRGRAARAPEEPPPEAPPAPVPETAAKDAAATSDVAAPRAATTAQQQPIGVAALPNGSLAERARQAVNQQAAADEAPPAAPAASLIESLRQRYQSERDEMIGMAQALEDQARSLRVVGLPYQAAKLQERARGLRLRAEQLPDMSAAKEGPALQQFNRLADAIERVMGSRPVAYEDTSPGASDGFFDDRVGRTFVNLNSPEMPVVATIVHEFKHLMRRRAEMGDQNALRAERALDRVWDMISDEGKKTYAEKYLFKSGATIEQVMADPTKMALLKEEMLADFMGKRATDKRFMRKLAKRDPETFGDFVREWIKVIDGLIDALRGMYRTGRGGAKDLLVEPDGDVALKDVDQFITKLEEAKAVAEEVMIEWARANPKLAQERDIDIQRFEGEGGRLNSRRSAPRFRGRMSLEELNSMQEPEKPGSELGAFNEFRSEGSQPLPDERERQREIERGILRQIREQEQEEREEMWGPPPVIDDPFADADDPSIPIGEASELSEAERQQIMLELEEEQQRIGAFVRPAPKQTVPLVDFSAVPDAKIKSAGIMAETAFPDLQFAPEPNAGGFDAASVSVGGRRYTVMYPSDALETGTVVPRDIVRDALDGERTPGQVIGARRLSIEAARQWSKRFIASAELFRRRFDILSAVPSNARKRVIASWKAIAALPKAFEFKTDVKARGKNNAEITQSIADQLLAGTKWRAEASRTTFYGGDGGSHADSVRVGIYKDGVYQGAATIEYRKPRGAGRPPVAVMHTAGFTAGSGAGKPFYQIAFALADARDATVEADFDGLLAINAYRRTEQQVSAALRSGKTKNVQPGYGQRIYGWSQKPTTQEQQDRNMARLMLAAARNAAEFFPGIRELNYDLKRDKFTFSDGTSAEAAVEIALRQPDVRSMSISRSTLARAAITFAAIDGRLNLDGITEVASPVLYSARAQNSDNVAGANDDITSDEQAGAQRLRDGGRVRGGAGLVDDASGPDSGSAQSAGDAGSGRADRGLGSQDVRPTYGKPRAGATRVVGYHYSPGDRNVLSSAMYGRGLQGAEAERLAAAPAVLRQRIYFYIDAGTGINPEAGVGGRAHDVELTNIYDADQDALRIVRDSRGFTAFEEAIVRAGFDGYMTRNAGPSGNVVLLGPHSVPVRALGGASRMRGEVVPPTQRKPSLLEGLLENRALPSGQLTGQRWKSLLTALAPDVVRLHGTNPAWDQGPLYKDELVRALKEGAMEEPLPGQPTTVEVDGVMRVFAPFRPAREAARRYAERSGIAYTPMSSWAKLDKERARRIAQAYDEMEHRPNDPEVIASYEALAQETLAQWRVIKETGLKVEFISGADPYGNPRNAVLDVINNNHLWVFPTSDGYGSSGAEASDDNPMLRPVQEELISGRVPVVNDIFRIVHDYFGHIKDGAGFRAEGEENAWRSHSLMYSPLARRALTVETRGQNSWVNFGPHAEFNKTASGADTVYAEQKLGLLPEWVSEEGLMFSARASRHTVAGGRVRATIDETVEWAQSQSSWRDWYTRYEQQLDEMFGPDAALFKGFLAATSQATTVKVNVALALKAYTQFYSGQPFSGFLPSVIKNLNRLVEGDSVAGAKISQYDKAVRGSAEGAPVDRHIAQLMFGVDVPNQRQIDAAHRRIRAVADRLGWAPREVQAALWAYNQVRKGKDPNKVESYDNILRNRWSDVIEARRLADAARAEGRGIRQPRDLAGRRPRVSGVQAAARTRDERQGAPVLAVAQESVDLWQEPSAIGNSGAFDPADPNITRSARQYAELPDAPGDRYSRWGDRTVSFDVRLADTGETATMTVPAAQFARTLSQRAEVFRSLITCLKR